VKIQEKLKKYEFRLSNSCSLFAAISDPRLNFTYLKTILDEEIYKKIVNEFQNKFAKYHRKYSTVSKSTEITKASSSLLQSIYKKRKFNEHEELEKYSQLPQEDSEIDPIHWWKAHETIYPCLSKLAFDILCVPATSVPTEQIFSKAGDIITKRRNKLSDNSIKSVMCLNSMYKFFD
jgi:Lhr-like helicase